MILRRIDKLGALGGRFPKALRFCVIILTVSLICALTPGLVFAGAPDPYKSGIEAIRSNADVVDLISADSEGLEYAVVLVSADGSPLSGSVYVASSRTLNTDHFFFEDRGGNWVKVGANGEIPLGLVASDSAARKVFDIGHILSFNIKVVSGTAGKPVFAMGLHSSCAAAFAMSMEAPQDCDISHIIGQATFGGEPDSVKKDIPRATVAFQKIATSDWVADGKTAYKLAVKVTDTDKPVSGAVALFYITDESGAATSGAKLSANRAVTDADGLATVSVTATEPGVYDIEAKVSDSSGGTRDLMITFLRHKPVLKFTVGSPFYSVDEDLRDAVAPSFIQDNRTYLSVRDMGDALGVLISWDQEAQAATLTGRGMVLRIPVDSGSLYANKGGQSSTIAVDAPAINKDGRVYLPFRAVFNAFGYEVAYNDAKREIVCK